MRLASHRQTRSRLRAIMLVEAMVYVALVALIGGLAVGTFFKFWQASRALDANADTIARMINAGERWRSDIRRATGPLRNLDEGDRQVTEIPHGSNTVLYAVQNGEIQRRGSPSDSWVPLIGRVKSSEMKPVPRQHVTAWGWEIELTPGKLSPKLRPRFTFLAVPGTDATP